MTSVRLRTCAAGAALAALAGILVDHGAVFGSDFPPAALLGVVLGAVVGLVPDRSAVERLGGFAAGFAAAWLGYLVRAGMLPDIPMGRAITAVLVVSVITAVATSTADRVPLWAGLTGAGAMVGAYELTYVAAPTDVAAGSVVAATSVLLAAAFGFALTNAVAALTAGSRPEPAPAGPVDAADASLPLFDAAATDAAVLPAPRRTSDVPTTSETTR